MDKQSIIPLRIMIEAPFSSGKMTFIQKISEIEEIKMECNVTPNRLKIPTVYMEFGKVTADEMDVLYLLGIPGSKGLKFIWEHMLEAIDGVIVLIDSCRVETFRQVRHILDYCEEDITVPYIVAANKQDLPDAWSAQDIQIALKLKEPVIPCCAHDMASVKHVLLTLLERVLARIDEEEHALKMARVEMLSGEEI